MKSSGSLSGPAGPCDGIRVIDMSSIVSGPLGSRFLADLGATVVKIETEKSDLAMRHNPPVHKGHSAYYEQVNFGKKSVCLDPKTEKGVATIKALCQKADVFFQNSRPGVMERLGLGYETLKEINPGLVYISVTGFGEDNRYANHVAYDQAIQGLVGFMPAQGSVEQPQAFYTPLADKITSLWAANATLAALLYRERNGGVGQKVVINMVTAYASMVLNEEMNNETFRSVEFPSVSVPSQPYQPLKTKDGFVVGLILQPQQYKAFCKAVGRADLQDDPRFTSSATLVRGATEIYRNVAKDVAELTTEDFLERMREAGVPFAKVNTTREFMESDVAAEVNAYVDIEDSEFGVIRHLNFPAHFSVSPANTKRRAPKLGEHNEEFLASLAAQTG